VHSFQLYIIDIMLFVTTSGEVRRTLTEGIAQIAVDIPADPGEVRERPIAVSFAESFLLPPPQELKSSRSVEIYNLRVRAAALVLETVQRPRQGAAPDLSRLRALDIMTSNLLVQTHSAWVAAVADVKTRPVAEACVSSERLRAARARSGMLFMTLITLHA
jgi:hypothetical protein